MRLRTVGYSRGTTDEIGGEIHQSKVGAESANIYTRIIPLDPARREASIYTIFMSIRDVTPFPAFFATTGETFSTGGDDLFSP